MLNGLDPIIIFHVAKLAPSLGDLIAKIPVISQIPSVVELPPIPIYLSEEFFGLYIDSEEKSVDISTDFQTKSDGSTPDVNQTGVSSVVTVNLIGKKDSISLILLSALMDYVFDKVTSKEYAITYIHGPTTIFRGLLQNFSVSQQANTDLLTIKIELTKGQKQPTPASSVPTVNPVNTSIDNLPNVISQGFSA